MRLFPIGPFNFRTATSLFAALRSTFNEKQRPVVQLLYILSFIYYPKTLPFLSLITCIYSEYRNIAVHFRSLTKTTHAWKIRRRRLMKVGHQSCAPQLPTLACLFACLFICLKKKQHIHDKTKTAAMLMHRHVVANRAGC